MQHSTHQSSCYIQSFDCDNKLMVFIFLSFSNSATLYILIITPFPKYFFLFARFIAIHFSVSFKHYNFFAFNVFKIITNI